MTLFEMITGALISVLLPLMGVLWNKIDAAEKNAESNRIFLTHLSRQLDKTNDLAQRLTSLEATVNIEIKNLSVSIKRMESVILQRFN